MIVFEISIWRGRGRASSSEVSVLATAHTSMKNGIDDSLRYLLLALLHQIDMFRIFIQQGSRRFSDKIVRNKIISV